MRASYLFTVAVSLALASAQPTKNPFPSPINSTDAVILVKSVDFAQIPFAGTEAPRLMLLIDEPGTHRLFVNAMRGPIYSVSYNGHSVKEYIDINAPQWSIDVHFSSHDSGFQSFAFHPEFNQHGKPGYGKFYTYTDTSNITPKADFLPKGKGHAHDTVLLEWSAKNPRGCDVRWWSAARTLPHREALPHSQRWPTCFQSACKARHRRLWTALRGRR
jgi:hypothetical protein